MSVINFDRPSPELCKALSEFYAAKLAFRGLIRDAAATGMEMCAKATEIAWAEEAIFHAIDHMKVPEAKEGG